MISWTDLLRPIPQKFEVWRPEHTLILDLKEVIDANKSEYQDIHPLLEPIEVVIKDALEKSYHDFIMSNPVQRYAARCTFDQLPHAEEAQSVEILDDAIGSIQQDVEEVILHDLGIHLTDLPDYRRAGVINWTRGHYVLSF